MTKNGKPSTDNELLACIADSLAEIDGSLKQISEGIDDLASAVRHATAGEPNYFLGIAQTLEDVGSALRALKKA